MPNLENKNSAQTAVSQYDDILKSRKKSRRANEFRKTIPMLLMMLPGMIYLICNNYLPMFGILIAFKVNFSVGIIKAPGSDSTILSFCSLQKTHGS